ncbi:hypothetical protein C8J57DRAFT_1630519 [Mycena rebaudengoi]|nr:hypothetical protein C8J57DRAFT_1630519 [Mycena rebaudengoi]
MYDSYAAEYPPWNPYDQPFPAAYHQQHLPPAATPRPRRHTRIRAATRASPSPARRTPEHPRLRTAQACEKCRTRKAKCSGEDSACPRCLARGLVCEYAREGRVRKPKGRAHSSSHSSTHSAAPNGPNADPPVKRRRCNTTFAAGSPVKLEPLSSCVPLALHPNPKRLSLPTMLGFGADGEYLRQLGGDGGDYTSARDYPHLGTRTTDYPLGDYPDYPHMHTSSAAYDYPYPDSLSSPTAHALHPTLHYAHPQLYLDLCHQLFISDTTKLYTSKEFCVPPTMCYLYAQLHSTETRSALLSRPAVDGQLLAARSIPAPSQHAIQPSPQRPLLGLARTRHVRPLALMIAGGSAVPSQAAPQSTASATASNLSTTLASNPCAARRSRLGSAVPAGG